MAVKHHPGARWTCMMACVLAGVVAVNAQAAFGQGGGGGGGGGTGGTGGTGTIGGTGSTIGSGSTGSTSGGLQSGTGSSSGLGSGSQAQPNIQNTANLNIGQQQAQFEALENPFVGATASSLTAQGEPNSWVGNSAQSMTGSSGGGTSGGSSNRAGTGGASGLRNTGLGGMNQFGQMGGAGSSMAFAIPRGGVRAGITNRIAIERPTNTAVGQRFQGRLARTPAAQSLDLRGISLTINGGTAIVSGQVASQEDAERIVRQLRLEPGIFRIDNRLTVGQ